MNEDILSFIWRFQYFETSNLQTDENLNLSVIRTGNKNGNAGPDFSEARVMIGQVQWVGSVEIHVRSSDWLLHMHEKNAAYESVVLHVVWENDKPVVRKDGTLLPTLSLKGRIKDAVLERYAQLQDENESIPCAGLFGQVSDILKYAMLDRVLLERLDKKAQQVTLIYEETRNDWEETAYLWLCQHFGFKLNDPAFSRLARILPWKILRKHRGQLSQIEALLFGCAGMLSDETDEPYVRLLRKEHQFLSAKYGLSESCMNGHEWKYSRLRPAGFPTVRLAQLAQFLNNEGSLFTELVYAGSFAELRGKFHLEQSAYWKSHYLFGKKSRSSVPSMGKDAAHLLIINAAVPLLVAYSKQKQRHELLDKAVYWLSEIEAENNRITREWNTLGIRVTNAADSQALLEWHNLYCTPRRCLECTVGAALVRSV
ncbi:DUF2851 family protein [Dyadobacter bucti]|uniref:DUF2851 family protein n=1 Tax=Dyadobacter bucti TaxID=2572203 RepID=UPI003F722F09